MAFRFRDRETDRHDVEIRRLRQCDAARGEITAGDETQFVSTDRQRPVRDQRLVGASVIIGDGANDQAVGAGLRQLPQFDADAGGGHAAMHVEHVGR